MTSVEWLPVPDGWREPPSLPTFPDAREYQPAPGSLGSIPRGFYETQEDCDDTAPAFVRGLLLTRAEFDAKFTTLDDYPRWILYGGPVSTRQLAIEYDRYMFFYAHSQNLVWVSEGTPCIVKGYRIPWPADSSFRWEWVYETSPPRSVKRVWDPAQSKYVYVWS